MAKCNIVKLQLLLHQPNANLFAIEIFTRVFAFVCNILLLYSFFRLPGQSLDVLCVLLLILRLPGPIC